MMWNVNVKMVEGCGIGRDHGQMCGIMQLCKMWSMRNAVLCKMGYDARCAGAMHNAANTW